MANRWIVDVDGRGSFAVAEESNGRTAIVSTPGPLHAAERQLARLRTRDAARAHAARVAGGKRLARRNRRQEG